MLHVRAKLLHFANNEEPLEKISCYTTRNSLQLLLLVSKYESILSTNTSLSFLFRFSHAPSTRPFSSRSVRPAQDERSAWRRDRRATGGVLSIRAARGDATNFPYTRAYTRIFEVGFSRSRALQSPLHRDR